MSDPASKAVFLSYASQDAEAAKRICEALRAAGVEVWFDQDALVGGDAWDGKIRGQINSCALFIPVISAATQERLEGYFRLEWKLAANRSHTMAEERTFLLPVVIDTTRDADGKVPSEFRSVQWTKLPGGEASAAFVSRVQKLLGGSTVPAVTRNPESVPPRTSAPAAAKSAFPVGVAATLGVVVLGLIAFVALRPTAKETTVAPAPAKPVVETNATTAPSAAPVAADQKSVAVLAFANMSPEKDTEYFSDGISEEILNALDRIPALRVTPRTSSFSFKGKNVALDEIGRALRVASLIEGSVRKSGNEVRITVKLLNAADGTRVWFEEFNRQMTPADMFAVQSEIAAMVAQKLGGASAASATSAVSTIAVPTKNLAAYDAYLRGRAALGDVVLDRSNAVVHFDEALRLDPNYALAWADLALRMAHKK